MTSAFVVLRSDRPRLPQMLARFALETELPLLPLWREIARLAEGLEALDAAEQQVKQQPPPANLAISRQSGIPRVRASLPRLESMLVSHMLVTPGVALAALVVALTVLR